MAPVLVTGGAGFIGSHLIDALVKRGRDLVVLDKRPIRSTLFRHYQVDLARSNALPKEVASCEKIVHLAAEVSVASSVKDPISSARTNIVGTISMLELARRVDASFTFASTAAIYPDRKRPCREEDSPDPKTPYAVSKLASEQYCKVYSKLYGLPAVVLRYFNVYGPGRTVGETGVVSQFIARVSRGRPPVIYGDGRQTRDFVFINDVVKATVKSMDAMASGFNIMNVGTGKANTITMLAKKIIRLAGLRDLNPVYAPARTGDIRFSRADISRVRSNIGFNPEYSLDRGLAETLRPRRRPS